jgi:hypothetical protein
MCMLVEKTHINRNSSICMNIEQARASDLTDVFGEAGAHMSKKQLKVVHSTDCGNECNNQLGR